MQYVVDLHRELEGHGYELNPYLGRPTEQQTARLGSVGQVPVLGGLPIGQTQPEAEVSTRV